jgi:hypothetical protein
VNQKLQLLTLTSLVAVAIVLPVRNGMKTNCGGNSAALANVQAIAIAAVVGAADAPDHRFHFSAVTGNGREEFARRALNHWLPKAHFLVSRTPVSEGEPKRIIVVCDTPYRNVPQRWFGSARPTHAAGYSDGTYGLISTNEFAAINRPAFVALDELYPRKSE